MTERARQRIAIDMDDTMADAMSEHVRRYNAAYGANLSVDDLHGCDIEDWCPPAHRDALFEMLDASFFAGLAILPDCETVVRELSHRHDVFIVSAAMDVPTSFEAKFQWLQRHFPFIPPARMVFCGDKSIIDADYLIDDQPRHFENFRGRPLLFTAPHNALEERYTRVNNWREVRDFFARLGR
jgi:5'(3')-deoxyribonucleotidase